MKTTIRYLLGVLGILLSTVTYSQATEVAKVLLSIGQNQAQLPEQQARLLKRKSPLFQSDMITTGSKGQLQLRFSDNSRLSLRQNTQFSIESYQFDEKDKKSGKAIYRLLKGGMRTITGKISPQNSAHYEVKAPIATIGIRGTHYSLFYCDLDCKATQGVEQGLYGYVLEGTIVVTTGSITSNVGQGYYFFLGGEGSRLVMKPEPFDLFLQLEDLTGSLLDVETDEASPSLDVRPDPELRLPDRPTDNYNYQIYNVIPQK